MHTLFADPLVRRARARVHELDAATLADQLELVQIPAPTFEEAARGREVRSRFDALGLTSVEVDDAGNVLGWFAGGPEDSTGAVALVAHLDTVFPAGTDLRPRRRGDRIYAPGITDNTRGLAALLTLARVLTELDVRTERPVLFVASVGEEGAGDLCGVKHLFREGGPGRTASACIALDGSGVRRIIHRAVGSRRFRVTLRGPGGHSWADWGAPSPVAALGTAVARLQEVPLPLDPRSTLTVARIGGGSSINSIPAEAWMEIDLRSEGPAALDEAETAVRSTLERAVAGENRRRRAGTEQLSAEVQVIGDRPSGHCPAGTALVRAATAATRAVGARASLASSSTDANVPMSLGIPAITLGAGGESGGIHTPDEWYRNERGAEGVERALLTLLAAAGIRG